MGTPASPTYPVASSTEKRFPPQKDIDHYDDILPNVSTPLTFDFSAADDVAATSMPVGDLEDDPGHPRRGKSRREILHIVSAGDTAQATHPVPTGITSDEGLFRPGVAALDVHRKA